MTNVPVGQDDIDDLRRCLRRCQHRWLAETEQLDTLALSELKIVGVAAIVFAEASIVLDSNRRCTAMTRWRMQLMIRALACEEARSWSVGRFHEENCLYD